VKKHNQVNVKYIEQFPALPKPYAEMDWNRIAKEFTAVTFDELLKGPYLPLVNIRKIDEPTTGGYVGDAFTISSYIGPHREGFGEALTCIGAVLGASLSGEKMDSYRSRNWVAMCEAYYASVNGYGLVLNNVNVSNTCGSFWYDLFPSCLYFHVGALYPEDESVSKNMRDIAEAWLAALPALSDNWDHTGFSFKDMAVADTGKWVEPDAAIGIAYIEYMAYLKWGEAKFLEAAKLCMKQIEAYTENPYYEILGSYGPYLAARMNAEEGTSLSVGKFLQFVFDSTSGSRPGWGVISDRWGDADAHGLSGSTTDTAGYAFSMNTYVNAALIAPMVRYTPEYSRAVGKYLLHASSNSRLYFPDHAEPHMQSDYDWYKETKVNCISYEGVRNEGTTTPYSTGDASKPRLNMNPYGAWGVGMMAAIYDSTNVEGILRIDVLKTDFEHAPAYPTYLYYNPFEQAKAIEMDLGERKSDLYDCVSKEFLVRGVAYKVSVTLEADEAMLIVVVPADGAVIWEHEKMLINGIVVDYKGKFASYDTTDVEIPQPHLSLNKPVKASSTSSPEYAAENVVTADWRTRWISGEDPLQWIYVDLQGRHLVNKVKLRWIEGAHAVNYRIQVSADAQEWTDVYATDRGDGDLDTIKLDTPAEAGFVRVYCTDKGDRKAYELIELEVYGSKLER
jgi:hypothetical protein